jgi:hypothetical protein
MNKKRRSRRRYTRKSPRNCERAWSIAERIAYYSKPDPLSGCRIWHGYLEGGYGCLYFQNKQRFAHRLAWEVKHGPIPDGLVLRHRCNARGCCNPDHLVPGTRAENNADQKAERLRLAAARAATAPTAPVLRPTWLRSASSITASSSRAKSRSRSLTLSSRRQGHQHKNHETPLATTNAAIKSQPRLLHVLDDRTAGVGHLLHDIAHRL